MKRRFIFLLVILCAVYIFAEDQNRAFKIGIQAGSNTFMGLIIKSGSIEAGLKARIDLLDQGDGSEFLLAGAHLAWLFNSRDGQSSFGTGVDFRAGFGFGYSEYVDAFLRLNYNYHISDHFMLTALFYPFSFSTREEEDVANSWYSTVTIPSAGLAAAVFF